MSDEKKVTKGWCPKSDRGQLWINWIQGSRRDVIGELNIRFAGWREEGYTVVPVNISERTIPHRGQEGK